MNENRRHYYFTAEGLSVGYDGKPLIRDIDISVSYTHLTLPTIA